MEQISIDEFFKRLDGSVPLENFEVGEDAHRTIDGNQRIFSNCKFKTLTLFTRLDNIFFSNCTFEKLYIEIQQSITEITVNNCQATCISIQGKDKVTASKIDLLGTKTQIDEFKLGKDFYCSKITIGDAKTINRCSLSVNCGSLIFINVQSVDYLVISGEVKQMFEIKNCTNLTFFNVNDLTGHRFE
jgi:hypothetical protein